jgi:5'-3' exoribonuclease 1
MLRLNLWATSLSVALLVSCCRSFAPVHSPLFSTQNRIQTTHFREKYGASSSSALFGIPKMFRWLTDQYPNIINNRLEEGLSKDVEVDNFYLDMNGIIHPCTHGNAEGELIFLDETLMFKKIFMYVDRLYKMVQPSKILYLAVDGVAPRAKMNQQRSRRFRSAKEAETLAAELMAREQYMGDAKPASDKTRFDSNCITPGTDFMLKLSLALQKWVDYKMKTDPFWQNGAKVIISGPDVPGEGEHKVMEFIRDTKEKYDKGEKTDDYGPQWTHVLYGLDADLIMLGLVTHEPNFMLLREKMSVVMAGRGRNKYRKKKDMMEYDRNDFELLELTSLRQLLAIQFRKFSDELTGYSLDRIIDDFVFMCILVGNDFLPHCPHMEIDSGAISLMMTNYIDLLPEWGGYLTDKEKIHPKRFEAFVYNLAVYEEEHFKRRGYQENEPGWKLPAENEQEKEDFYGTLYSGKPTPAAAVAANSKGTDPPPKKEKKAEAVEPEAEAEEAAANNDGPNRAFRRRHPGNLSRSYRDFYYDTKLHWPVEDRDRTLFQRRAHVRDYMEGLHWVLNYYHNGCPAWDWYFPHFYSPLSTDIVNLDEFYNDSDNDSDSEEGFKTLPFELGIPVPSLVQLLSVLPPQSAALLPDALSELMLHPSSPLIEYYPPDFTSDPNGKRQSWEAIVEIPFIESGVLLDTVSLILDKDKQDGSKVLTAAERRRNILGAEHAFVPPGSSEKGVEDLRPSQVNKGGAGAAANKGAAPTPKGARKSASKDPVTGNAGAAAAAAAPARKRASAKGESSTKKKAAE